MLTAVVGSAVGELMIFTQPTGAEGDARAYRSRGAISLTVMPMTLAGAPGGLALWLHGYYASHASPVPVHVKTLRDLSGAINVQLPGFRRQLRRAHKDLDSILKFFQV